MDLVLNGPKKTVDVAQYWAEEHYQKIARFVWLFVQCFFYFLWVIYFRLYEFFIYLLFLNSRFIWKKKIRKIAHTQIVHFVLFQIEFRNSDRFTIYIDRIDRRENRRFKYTAMWTTKENIGFPFSRLISICISIQIIYFWTNLPFTLPFSPLYYCNRYEKSRGSQCLNSNGFSIERKKQ